MNRSLASLALVTTSASLLLLAACEGDDSTPLNVYSGGPDASRPDATVRDALPDVGPDAAQITLTFVKEFRAVQGEIPDGLEYRDGEAFVAFAPTAKVVKIAADGTLSTYAQLPDPPGKGLTHGLAFDAAGNLYVAHTAATPADPLSPPGIYKIPAGGSDGGTLPAAPWATSATMTAPNGLAFDAVGNLYVADTGGSIFKFPPAGGDVAAPWSTDSLLASAPGCPGPDAGVPTGATAVVLDSANLYVTNNARGAVVRFALVADGGAGAPTDFAQDCALLRGIDGLTFDARDSSLLVANSGQGAVNRVSATGQISVVLRGAPLDSPAKIRQIPGQMNPEAFLLTNSAFTSALDGGAARPGLMKLTIP